MIPNSEANLVRNLPSGRKHYMEDDQTFLPPALSSYSIALLNEKSSMSDNHNQTKSKVTGIYDLDFPGNSSNTKLKRKLYKHFSQVSENSVNEQSNNHQDMKSVPKDNSEPNDLSKNSTIHSYRGISAADIENHSHSSHYSTPIKSIMDNAMLSNNSFNQSENWPITSKETPIGPNKEEIPASHSDNNDSKEHVMPPVKRIKGAKRYGRLLSQNSRRVFSEPIPNTKAVQGQAITKELEFDLGFANKEKEMELRKRIEEQKKINEQQNVEKRNLLTDLPISNYQKETNHKSNHENDINFKDNDKYDSIPNLRSLREPLKEVPTNNFAFRKPKTPKLLPLDTLPSKSQNLGPNGAPKIIPESLKSDNRPEHQITNSNKQHRIETRSQADNDNIFPKDLPIAVQNSISARKLDHHKEESTPRKKMIVINNIQYEKLELVGRGGTSKVYKVKCVNDNHLYAIKKVVFDQFDQVCIKGFKGEIDLLSKFKGNTRVVQLIDYAIGEGSLYLIMECGEIDLSHVLHNKLSKCNELDLNFVRFYAIEMFKCVQTVHDAEIVHSDLKPANFLFVRGILKIIDFGIANAVPEHTANVYRDSQIGTPNYMAPEAIIDVNDSLLPVKNDSDRLHTWKVGKPSDVWSCGCIIYQMIYGKPPYGKYQGNQRIMAIINPQVKIQFPTKGLGGVKVPTSAIELMQNCLSRFPGERWTVMQCLNSDFLKPKVVSESFVRDLVHLAVNFGYNNRVNGTGIITSDVYDKLVDTVLKQIDELNFS